LTLAEGSIYLDHTLHLELNSTFLIRFFKILSLNI